MIGLCWSKRKQRDADKTLCSQTSVKRPLEVPVSAQHPEITADSSDEEEWRVMTRIKRPMAAKLNDMTDREPEKACRICMADRCNTPIYGMQPEKDRLKFAEIQLARTCARKMRELAIDANTAGEYATSVNQHELAITYDEKAAQLSAHLIKVHKATGCVMADVSHGREYSWTQPTDWERDTTPTYAAELAEELKMNGAIYLCPGDDCVNRTNNEIKIIPEVQAFLETFKSKQVSVDKFRQLARSKKQEGDWKEAARLHGCAVTTDFEAFQEAKRLDDWHKKTDCFCARL